MSTTKYDNLLIGVLSAINSLALIRESDATTSEIFAAVKILVATLGSTARFYCDEQVEDGCMVIIDCVQQSVSDLLDCIDSNEQPSEAIVNTINELSQSLIFSTTWSR